MPSPGCTRRPASGSGLQIAEACAVVESLSLAMSGGQAMVLPLLQLKEFDQYTTTHAINVVGADHGAGRVPRPGRGNGPRLRARGAAPRPGEDQGSRGDPEQAGEAHRRGARHRRVSSRRGRAHDPGGRGAARSRGGGRVRAPPPRSMGGGYPALHYPRRRPPPAAGPRVRRLRCPAHQASLSRRLDLGGGAGLHREARRRRIRSRRRLRVRGDDAAVGPEDRDRCRTPSACAAVVRAGPARSIHRGRGSSR